jgi:hypothetical protein
MALQPADRSERPPLYQSAQSKSDTAAGLVHGRRVASSAGPNRAEAQFGNLTPLRPSGLNFMRQPWMVE